MTDQQQRTNAGLDAKVRELQDKLAKAERERDELQQQAEIWAQEARTQNATVHEIYQLCSGATGEQGSWHGAEPVRRVIEQRDAFAEALRFLRPYLNHERRLGNTQQAHNNGVYREREQRVNVIDNALATLNSTDEMTRVAQQSGQYGVNDV